jgi:prepilin-type N-terminal cleavage/methylation domain-containing protein
VSARIAESRAGFTLIELMISLVVLSAVMGATLAVFRSQNSGFRLSGERLELYQNMRYAITTIDRMLRTSGAGVANQQPMFIYGGNDIVAFNTNYTHNVQDNCAVNINPNAPVGSFEMLPLASAYVLPNTAWTYPAMNYPAGPCLAETVVFYFRPDSTTPDPLDFMLIQRINARPPEMVSHNLLPYPGRPFFEYFVHPRTLIVPPAARDSLVQANLPGSGVPLPIIHRAAVHGSPTDTLGDQSNSYHADSVKAVRINLRVTNGRGGAAFRTRDISTVVSLPNNGLVQAKTCGNTPLLGGALTVTPNAVGDPPSLTLGWPASVDEATGETDVTQYNIYRRLSTEPTFGSALITIPAGQPSPYLFQDIGVNVGQAYFYAVAAQDCTPSQSAMLANPMAVGPT